MRTALLYSFICISICLSAQDNCVDCLRYFRFIPSSSFPNNSQDFDIRFNITFEESHIVFDEEQIEILQEIQIPIANKTTLLKETNCLYTFSELSNVLTGTISRFRIDESAGPLDKNFSIFTLEDCGKVYYYLLNGDGLHQLLPCAPFLNQRVTSIAKAESFSVFQNILFESDTSSDYSLEQNIEYETVNEQVLTKSAYDTILIEAAEFDTVTEAYFYGDSATCHGAIYDTTFFNGIVKEGSFTFEAVNPTFEDVTEQVLLKDGFPGVDFYIQEFLISDTVKIPSFAYNLSIVDIDPNCNTGEFTSCLELKIDTILIKDTSIYRLIYPPCRDGYTQKGRFCYTDGGFVETQYSTRSYSRLKTPVNVTLIEHPAEFRTLTKIQLLNKEEIPDSCIVPIYKTYQSQLVQTLSKITIVEVPATYETRQYQKYLSGSQEFQINNSTQDKSVNYTSIEGGHYIDNDFITNVIKEIDPCLLYELASILIKNNYIEEVDKNTDAKVLLGLAQYQLDNNLPIGIIDDLLLEKLGLND